ncbi:MAG: CorA family divalent cation transporter [Myxococcota bacterium]
MQSIHSLMLDGRGGARAVDPSTTPAPGEVLWLHLDLNDAEQARWVRTSSGLEPVLAEAMLAVDTRPRSFVNGDGLFLNMRGINVSSDSEPEDMVALRMWFEASRVVTVRRRHLQAAIDVSETLANGSGPTSAGRLLTDLVERLLFRIGGHIAALEDEADELEEIVMSARSREPRARISELRRNTISLRRYLAPQRETITRLHAERVTWLDDTDRAELRETGDAVTRYLEILDSTRERAAVSSEELSNRLAEQMNNTMYMLSIVTAIFLPLGLLTGLLGINVGGMPGVDSPWAFSLVVVFLVLIGVAEYLWFRSQRLV